MSKIKKVIMIIGLVIIGFGGGFVVFRLMIQIFSTPPTTLGYDNGKFAPCPNKPNCVSSQAEETSAHYIAPIPFEGDVETAQATMLTFLTEMPRAKIISSQPNYIHLETTSPLVGYVDDTELYFDETAQLIQVRAAARLGYSDLDKNRARVEQIRQAFYQANQ